MTNIEFKQHESYGVIELSNTNSTGTILVGSEVQHQHFFHLVIKEAEKDNSFGEIRFHGHKTLIDVMLSANQLMDLITQTNKANATPCTIRSVQGVRRENPPIETPRVEFAAQYGKEEIKVNIEQNKEIISSIMEECSGLPKKKQDAIKNALFRLTGNNEVNAKFYLTKITEATEKSIQIAKTEIESFVSSTVRALGLKSLKELVKTEEKEEINNNIIESRISCNTCEHANTCIDDQRCFGCDNSLNQWSRK